MATPINTPRVGQPVCEVAQGQYGLVGKMNFWLQQQLKFLGRNPDTGVTSIVPGPSPFTYQNGGDFTVDAIVTGGTVSAVEFSRDNVNFFPVATGTQVSLNPNDYLRVTYSVVPSITLIPR